MDNNTKEKTKDVVPERDPINKLISAKRLLDRGVTEDVVRKTFGIPDDTPL